MKLLRSLRVRLFVAFALVVLVAVGTFSVFVTRLADQRFDEYEDVLQRLQITRMAQWLVGFYEESESWEGVQPYAYEMQALSGTAVVIADASGTIVGDSRYSEVSGLPPSNWITHSLVGRDGENVGTLYLSGERTIQEVFRGRLKESLGLLLVLGSLFGVLVALGVSTAVAGMISAPVRQLADFAQATGRGDFSHRLALRRSDELGDLGEAFNRMAGELDAAFQHQRNLVADTAHELRTPLTNVRGYLEAFEDGILEAAEAMPVVRDEVELLQRLVEDLQQVAIAESGNLRLQRKEVTVTDLVGHTVASRERALRASGLEVRIEIPEELPPVWVDPQRIGQVLSNILLNAIRHTPEGGAITITARESQGGVEVSLCDTGTGIPEEQLPRIFDRFHRVDPSRSRETGGSGLGLTIARLLVESHGGTIIAENNPQGGSCFSFTLPARPDSPEPERPR
jgi:signal transduction histidine kinase